MPPAAPTASTCAHQQTETSLSLLAERYPLLLSDLRRWLAGPGRQVAAETTRGAAADFVNERYRFTAQVNDFSLLGQQLETLLPNQILVHLLHSPAALVQTLGDPHLHDALQHPKYTPLLLLPINDALHLQQWLLDEQPKHWPWTIADQVRTGPARESAVRFSRELHALLEQMCMELRIRLRSGKYADRPTPGDVLRAGERPLRLLTPANSNSAYQQFCARDMRDGLRVLGSECNSVFTDHSKTAQYELLKAIDEHDPDVLILNGFTRAAFSELPEQLTLATWDQDYVASASPDAARSLGPRDVLAVMVEDWVDDAHHNGADAESVHHLNLGANVELYHPPACPAEPKCDVLFVGNFHPFERYRALIGFDTLAPNVQRLMLEARKRLDAWISTCNTTEEFIIPDCGALLIESQRSIAPNAPIDPAQLHALSQYFRYRIAHMLVRERFIEALSAFNIGLYGTGWDALPVVAQQHAGVIANGPPLRDAVHHAAIVLHLHTWTVHHPRLYDSAAAGGFVLVGRVPERNSLDTVFEPGTELDSFGSIAEMQQKIRWWLHHPQQRQACARAAAARVRREHAMSDRMQQLLDIFRNGRP